MCQGELVRLLTEVHISATQHMRVFDITSKLLFLFIMKIYHTTTIRKEIIDRINWRWQISRP